MTRWTGPGSRSYCRSGLHCRPQGILQNRRPGCRAARGLLTNLQRDRGLQYCSSAAGDRWPPDGLQAPDTPALNSGQDRRKFCILKKQIDYRATAETKGSISKNLHQLYSQGLRARHIFMPLVPSLVRSVASLSRLAEPAS